MSKRPLDLNEILKIVDQPAVSVALRCYFTQWAGRRFESMGIADDLDTDRAVITATDLAAVRLLSVDVPPERIIDLLEGDLGHQLSLLLAEIPSDVDLGTTDADILVAAGSHADRAWRLLNDATGIGWVTAGKILARKRPRLIPVFDRVVRCVLAPPKDLFWTWLDEQLRDDNGVLRLRLATLHADLNLPNRISTIRIFDVIVWMLHQKTHTNPTCSGFDIAEVPVRPNCTTWLPMRPESEARTGVSHVSEPPRF